MSARKRQTRHGPARTQVGAGKQARARTRRSQSELLPSGEPSPPLVVADLEPYMAAFLAQRGRSGWSATAFLHGALELLDFSRFLRSLPAVPAARDAHARLMREVEGLAKTYLKGRRAQGLKPATLSAERRTLARFVRVTREVGLQRSKPLPPPSTAVDGQSTPADGGKVRAPLKRRWHGTRIGRGAKGGRAK